MAKAKEKNDWVNYEEQAREEGFCAVCGIDEAGRGPLAGPVYAAAVIMPKDVIISGINDSKKLSPAKREALFNLIIEKAEAYAIAYATVEEIEEINILQADFLAMRRAVEALSTKPDMVYIDGNLLCPGIECEQRAIVKGDANCHSIACASILAKVARDRVMEEYDKVYPQYGFAKHKGYGTKAHIEALREYGPCPAHRLSFLKKIEGIPR